MKLWTVVALPDGRSRLAGAAAGLILLSMLLSLNPLSQVANDVMRLECREQSVIVTSESGVPLTSEDGRYLIVAEKGRLQCRPVVW